MSQRPSRISPLLFLMAGQFVSVIGDWFFHIAAMNFVLKVTDSASLTGLIMAVSFLPMFILGPFAGAFVDRFDYRRVMIVTDLIQVGLCVIIPVLRWNGLLGVEDGNFALPIAVLGVVAFTLNVCAAMFIPARDSLVPMLASAERLSNANALVQGSSQAGIFLGPLLAAFLLTKGVDDVTLFLANGATFLLSAIFLVLMKTPADDPDRHSVRKTLLQDIGDLTTYIREHPPLRNMVLITFINNIFIMGPAMVGMRLFVDRVLGAEDQVYAFGQAALGLGMVTMSFALSFKKMPLPVGSMWVAALIFDGLSWVPIAFARSPEVFYGIVYVHALGIPFLVVTRTIAIQQLVPKQFRGRVFSLIHLAVFGCMALSNLLTGLMAEVLSTDVIFVGIGIGGALTGVAAWYVGHLDVLNELER